MAALVDDQEVLFGAAGAGKAPLEVARDTDHRSPDGLEPDAENASDTPAPISFCCREETSAVENNRARCCSEKREGRGKEKTKTLEGCCEPTGETLVDFKDERVKCFDGDGEIASMPCCEEEKTCSPSEKPPPKLEESSSEDSCGREGGNHPCKGRPDEKNRCQQKDVSKRCCGSDNVLAASSKLPSNSYAKNSPIDAADDTLAGERCALENTNSSCATGDLGCCTKEGGPRCNEDCVLAYAKYDCMVSHPPDSSHFEEDAPCTDHLLAALDKYGAMLRKAICLCKSVSSSNIVQCCSRNYSKSALRGRARALKPQSSSASIRRCKKSCCEKKSPSFADASVPVRSEPKKLDNVDLEQPPNREDVMIAVQGMTCTGCEEKLKRALNSVPGVSDVSVVFVSGSAGFKVDTSMTDSKTVIARAQEITGFGITRIHREFHSIVVLMPKTVAASFGENLPPGVIDIEVLDKRTTRIIYDPHTIGARTLFEKLGSNVRLAPPDRWNKDDGDKKHLYTLGIKTAIASLLTVPVCVLAWANVSASEQVKGIVSMALATLVQLIAVTEFYWKAFRALFGSRTLELDMLVVISITAAYVYSVVAFAFLLVGQPLSIEGFFETSTLLISLVLLGRLLAVYARAKAIASVSMRSLQETMVTLTTDDSSERQIDARLLHYGDVFKVFAHAGIPTDGTVLQGTSDVDESMLTGESARVTKSTGSKIIAGTLNGEGLLHARVDRLPGENTITDIANMVEAAQASKPRVQDLADVVSGYFIPVVLTLALIVFVTWILVSVFVRDLPAGDAIISAITYTIAVLAVSCPCAVGLAVPMVLVIAGGVAARRGIIIKSASATERAWSVTDVIFDKTGTLTTGELHVADFEVVVEDKDSALSISLALAEASDHPVSRAVARHLTGKCLPAIGLEGSKSVPGNGVEAHIGGQTVRVGNPQWLGVHAAPAVQKFLSQALTLLCVTTQDQLLAVFAMQSTLRPEASGIVSELHGRGIRTHLLSGDAEAPVVRLGETLGIPEVRFRQSPADKRDYIEQLHAASPKRRLLFCGDGTNDAVAVAQADVGVAMGAAASDVTSGVADVALLGTLRGLVQLLDLSRAAYRRIVFNFVWSAVYNIFAIALAAGAFVAFRLPPAYAGLGELVSVLPVVLAATTMLAVGRRK